MDELTDIQTVLEKLRRERSDIERRVRVGSLDVINEWQQLEEKWLQMKSKGSEALLAVDDASDQIWVEVMQLHDELRAGYQRMRQKL